MGVEKIFIPDDVQAKSMAIHAFEAILEQYLSGNKTASEAREAIEDKIGRDLESDEVSEILTLVGYIDAGTGYTGKKERLSRIISILIASEHGVWYLTQATLRTALIQEIT